MPNSLFLRLLLLCCLLAVQNSSQATSEANPQDSARLLAPIRFLLSFDDGPSAASSDSPTEKILNVLAQNTCQPNIKAVFFTQTMAVNGGGTPVGRAMLKTEYEAGHLLALHTATPRHSSHRSMSAEELDSSLKLGISILTAITGTPPTLVRPPFWNYDARTLGQYHQNGMQMLLTDLSANDGVIYGINFSLHKRSNMLKMLRAVRERWRAGSMPVVDGNTPVVVTFHDVNSYTANHIGEYLEILLDVAHELEMPTAALPFYDERNALERAALASTVQDGDSKPDLPGIWNWIWH